MKNWLLNLNKYQFVFAVLIVSILFNTFLSLMIFLIGDVSLGNENEVIKNINFTGKFILAVIIAPILETFFFQYLLVEVPLTYLKKNKFKKVIYLLVSVISALVFASTHPFGIWYLIYAFTMGIFFAWVTILSVFERSVPISILYTVFIPHAFINLIAVLFE